MVAAQVQTDPPETTTPTLQAVPDATPSEAKPEPEKFQRRKSFTITCRYDERELPQNIQLRLGTYRAEISALNKSLRGKNETIANLRTRLRLTDRVMRLKNEARAEARLEAMDGFARGLAQLAEDEAHADA